MVEHNISRRVCHISSNRIKRNPIWPPRLHEIIKMTITPSIVVIGTSFSTIQVVYLSFKALVTKWEGY